MSIDSYERGYRAGYKNAKKEMKNEQAYKQGWLDALKHLDGLITIEIAKNKLERN